MLNEIAMVIATALITGGFSAAATVVALRVHITYIRESLTRQEHAINRAHQRIDDLECHQGRGGGCPTS